MCTPSTLRTARCDGTVEPLTPAYHLRALAAGEGVVFATSGVGTVTAHDASVGTTLWTSSANMGSPLFVRTDGTVSTE